MSFSRRALAMLLPALAADAVAQQPNTNKVPTAPPHVLGPKIFPFDELVVRTSANGAMKSRALFDGATTRGQRLTAHITELAPGHAPHPPERQKHEEIFILRQGTLQVTLGGETSTIGPGSVIFVPFEELFGLKNVGTEVAQYYVISIEERTA
jgi:mannose-6-phosphate isomerase-like protein (cupin superfamily)